MSTRLSPPSPNFKLTPGLDPAVFGPWTLTGGVISADAGTTAVNPDANDGATLGVSGTAWSDLFLASGATINFNANDVILTHSSNSIAVSGGTLTSESAFISGTGEGGTVAATGNTLRAPDLVTGGADNLTGADLTISAGLGTGTGDVGTIILSMPIVAAAGDNLQTRGAAITFDMIASTTVLTMTLNRNTIVSGTWNDLGVVTTVDINGGTVDGANIGVSSAGTGAFTTLATSGIMTASEAIDITIADSVNNVALTVTQNDTTNNPNAMNILNTGTGFNLFLDTDADTRSISIDSEATTAPVIYIPAPATTSGSCFFIDGASALTTGNAFKVESNSADTNVRNVAFIVNNNTLAVGATPLSLQQDAVNEVLILDQNANADGAAFIDYQGTTGANATSPVSTHGTSGATTDHIQIKLNGTRAWIAVSTNDPTA